MLLLYHKHYITRYVKIIHVSTKNCNHLKSKITNGICQKRSIQNTIEKYLGRQQLNNASMEISLA